MRLTRISVEGVGRFAEAVTVDGLQPGLNVLAAPNEAGKSTLFKAVRACIFQKHTANDKTLRELACEGARVPATVELAFEHAGASWLARKSFFSGPRASLMRDGREIAAGRAADEALIEALGLRPGSGRAFDEAAYGLLWVAQSDSFHLPDLAGAAKDAVSSAVEHEVGVLAGGERARRALRDLDQRLDQLFNKNGSPKSAGPLGQAEARAQELAARLAQEEALLAALDRDIEALEQARRKRARLDDPAVEGDLRRKLAEARQEREDAGRAAAALRDLEKDEKLAAGALQDARRAYEDLAACATRIDAAQARMRELASELEPLTAEERAAQAELDAATADLAARDRADADAMREDADLRREAAVVAAFAERPALEARLAALDRLVADLAAAQAARGRIRVTDRQLQDAERLDREIALLRDRLDAAAPRIDIAPLPGRPGAMRVSGRAVDAPESLAATGVVTIEIDGVGAVVVTPPPGLGAAEREDLRKREAQRAQLLAQADCADLPALRAAREAARAQDERLASLRARCDALGAAEADLGAECARLRARLDAGGADAPQRSADDVAAALAALQDRREAGVAERHRLNGRIEALNRKLRDLVQRRVEAASRLAEQRARLAADLERLPEADRATRLEAAAQALAGSRRAHETVRLDLEALRASAPGADRLADIAARVGRLEAALNNQAQERRTLDQEISRLEGVVQVRGGDGLGEKTAALQDELALARRDVERLRAETSAMSLLRDTIRDAYEEQRTLLQQPIRRHLKPFLDGLFPRSELTLDDGFAVAGLARNGAPEMFDRLSHGTREQIAVLVRLAMGGLLHERGEDVPIILDDALVFCDDERIERMFDALNRAARRQQVIVLTCRGASFRSLGGKALEIAPLGRSLR